MTDLPSRLTIALADRYAIERELGEGGMATVFLARDLKHNRHVALKVLKPELAAVVGAERFLAEIETTANLQHPHILPLFDSGEADGFLFYVMPFVDGESLRETLDRERQLPVDDAVTITVQLAEALDHAHRKGVIHRDIKPANVMLVEGKPVLSDFGIALAVGAAGGGRLTETGLSVGTPHYMSPEQATGESAIGPTTDVYALGCVLYEMLVGSPPYVGGTAQAILGKIITGSPDPVTEHRRTVPPHVDAAIRKALEKVPADRFRTMKDFAAALNDPGFRYGFVGAGAVVGGAAGAPGASRAAGATHPGSASPTVRSWKLPALLGWTVAATAIVAALFWPGDETAGVRDIGLPYDAPMSFWLSRNFDVARDGSFMVYVAASTPFPMLYYRSLDSDEVRPIRGTENATGRPWISPDGSRVAFEAEGQLRVVSVEGGQAATRAELADPLGGEWTEDGLIVFADADGRFIRWVDPETGPVRQVLVDYCISPQLISGGDEVLCGGGGNNAAYVRSLADSSEARFFRGENAQEGRFSGVAGANFRLIDDAYLVYMSPAGDLNAVAVLDRDSLVLGRSVTMVPGVRMEAYSGTGQYALTDDGTLVYVAGRNAEVGAFVVVDESGRESDLGIGAAAHVRFDFHPDGRQFVSVVEGVENQELRLYDLETGRFRVLDEEYKIGQPRWSPDGSHLAYVRHSDVEDEGLYLLEPNAPGGPRLLVEDTTGRGWMFPAGYVAEDLLLLGSGSSERSAALVDPTADEIRFESLDLSAIFISMSPDQRWLVYQRPLAEGIQLEPWPARNQSFQIQTIGGEPNWRSNSELVFWTLDDVARFYRVRVNPDRNPPFEDPVLWVADPRFADTDGPSYAISPAGDLVYKRSPDEDRGHYVRVVPGWVDEMKRAVDAANR